jgi:spoIIIJ-associated protein
MSEKKYANPIAIAQIESFLHQIRELSGLSISYDVSETDPKPGDLETPELLVKFSGSDTDLLLENKAELLLALEHLTQETLRMPSEDHSLLCFDANDHRLLRIEELRMSALTAAARVKETGKPFFFSSMTSRERRILHLALRDELELRSESIGAGPQRAVCVLPLKAPLPPAPPAPPMRHGPRPGSFAERATPGRPLREEEPRDRDRDRRFRDRRPGPRRGR